MRRVTALKALGRISEAADEAQAALNLNPTDKDLLRRRDELVAELEDRFAEEAVAKEAEAELKKHKEPLRPQARTTSVKASEEEVKEETTRGAAAAAHISAQTSAQAPSSAIEEASASDATFTASCREGKEGGGVSAEGKPAFKKIAIVESQSDDDEDNDEDKDGEDDEDSLQSLEALSRLSPEELKVELKKQMRAELDEMLRPITNGANASANANTSLPPHLQHLAGMDETAIANFKQFFETMLDKEPLDPARLAQAAAHIATQASPRASPRATSKDNTKKKGSEKVVAKTNQSSSSAEELSVYASIERAVEACGLGSAVGKVDDEEAVLRGLSTLLAQSKEVQTMLWSLVF